MSAYGQNAYGSGSYKCQGTPVELHFWALKKTFPVPAMAGTLDDDLHIEGRYLDNCYWQGQSLLTEMFPDKSEQLLASWRSMFNVTSTGSIAGDQAALIAKERVLVNKDGRLVKSYYKTVAEALGATNVTIGEGLTGMFIVSSTSPPATQLSAPLYSLDNIWTWWVQCTLATGRPYFEATLKALSPGFSYLYFIYL